MLELMLVLGLVALGGMALVVFAVCAVKLFFKLLFLPFALALLLLKVVAGVVLLALAVALAPLLLIGLVLLAVPLLLVAGLFGVGALAFGAT